MLTITNPSVTREQVREAFRGAHNVRLRERYHGILPAFEGKSCSKIAQRRYRNEETMRSWVHAVSHVGLQGLEREVIPGRPA
jgi:transposase